MQLHEVEELARSFLSDLAGLEGVSYIPDFAASRMRALEWRDADGTREVMTLHVGDLPTEPELVIVRVWRGAPETEALTPEALRRFTRFTFSVIVWADELDRLSAFVSNAIYAAQHGSAKPGVPRFLDGGEMIVGEAGDFETLWSPRAAYLVEDELEFSVLSKPCFCPFLNSAGFLRASLPKTVVLS